MKIAVVGSGISGLGAAWLLSHQHEVHLYEADSRLGGHAHTVSVEETARTVPVDTGFLVYNDLTYPNLIAFFKALQVETVASDMSLSIQSREQAFEWAGTNLNTIFGQRSNLFKPKFYKMLFEILRFGDEAEENLHDSIRNAWTLKELLDRKNYSAEFRKDYLLPMGSAIWSMPDKQMFEFPAATFMNFCINHKLLQVKGRPVWRTVKNGSVNYVNKAAAALQKIFLSTPVHRVERISGQVKVESRQGTHVYDKVVMATHAPVTLNILKTETDHEHRVLSAFSYNPNKVVLHNDGSFMPKRKRVWSSWNVYSCRDVGNSDHVSLTYYLNKLQPLLSPQDYFVTLNPSRSVQKPVCVLDYSHPQFNQAAIQAQKDLPSLQGRGGVYFAGAWSRYGFHEDGLLSAVKVAEHLSVNVPWVVQ